MMKHIKPLPISEEMLGAYIEGNLSDYDARYVERMLRTDEEFSAFVDELSASDDYASNCLMEDIPSFEDGFVLPEIQIEESGGMYASEHYDWSIHDGDYGFWELGLPPIITQEEEQQIDEIEAYSIMPDFTGDDMTIDDNLSNDDMGSIMDIL